MDIGFIGLGVMGKHMALNLAKSHTVTAYDIDPSKTKEMIGIVPASDITEAGKGSDVVFLSLPTSEIVQSAVSALLPSLRSGSAVIDTSTTNPVISQAIAEELNKKHIEFLDAPVSGGESGARDAKLSIMAGGSKETFAQYASLLTGIGSSVVHVGEIGAGGVAKLVNNMIAAAEFSVIAEGFALASSCGVDLSVLYEAIRGGWAGSAVLDVAAPGIIKRDFTPGGKVDVLFKDIGYALSLARDHNVPTPMTALSDEIFKAARASGRGPKAQQVIIEMWEELMGSGKA